MKAESGRRNHRVDVIIGVLRQGTGYKLDLDTAGGIQVEADGSTEC